MDIKVIQNDEKKSAVTHRDVIHYDCVDGNGSQSIDMIIRGGERKSVALTEVHKVLVIKPYCLFEKGVGFNLKK